MPIGKEDKIFYFINTLILLAVIVVIAVPIINVIANSFSDGDAVAAGKITFWPVDFSLEGYKAVFEDKYILIGYGNTIFYTVVGTLINVVVTVIAAYPLSRKQLPGRNVIMMLFAFTMIFNGGLIPNFLLVKDLGMYNTRWAMIIPGAISVYNMVICRTFFATNLPDELREAAEVDGCSEFRFFIRMALPLSKAVIAVIALYYAVAHWNAFFNAFIYLTNKNLYPLQLILRDVLISNTVNASDVVSSDSIVNYNLVETLKYSLIMVSCIPIWCVYPFVQKYFVKGVMIGAIKG
ncbi:MAG TPA: carbohydrate ABC transporter permease [Clostridiales bacterium]|nr:carbohydrate ABC transporter permease [Clostridiales bacterium]